MPHQCKQMTACAMWSRLSTCAAVGYRRRPTADAEVGRLTIGRSLPSCPTSAQHPSSQHLLVHHNVGALAHFAQPDIHILVGALAREGALDLVAIIFQRSEEHTSELQSLRHLVCR